MMLNRMTRKKKGILDMKVERNLVFERNINASYLYTHMKDLRREVAFLLNRMKSHIKKGYKPKKQHILNNYRQRFQKLMSYILIWRHYIILFYKEREARYYEKVYEQNESFRREAVKNDAGWSASQTATNLTEKLHYSKMLQR